MKIIAYNHRVFQKARRIPWHPIALWQQRFPDEFIIETKITEPISFYRQKNMAPLTINGHMVVLENGDTPYINGDDRHKRYFTLKLKTQYDPKEADKSYAACNFNVIPFTVITMNMDRRDTASILYKDKPEKKKYMIHCSFRRKIKNMRYLLSHLANRQDICYTRNNTHNFVDYANLVAQSKLVIAAPSVGDLCGRESDAMAFGTPCFRLKFKNRTYRPCVSGIHYFGFNHIDEVAHLINNIDEYFANKEFCDKYDYIREQGFKWYQDNASIEGSFKLFKEIIETYIY